MMMVLGLFFSLKNADIEFVNVIDLTWRVYTTTEVMFTAKRVEFIDKKQFIVAAIDENSKTFVIYIAALEVLELAKMSIYFLWAT